MLRDIITATYPSRSKTVKVEQLDKTVTLHELTIGFELDVMDNPTLDNPYNILLDAGMDAEDIVKLERGTAIELQNIVLKMTYPDAEEGESDGGAKKKLKKACLDLLAKGHIYVSRYPVSFFLAAYEHHFEAENEELARLAIGARAAHVDDFEGFIDSLKPVDHEANFKKIKGDNDRSGNSTQDTS